MTLESANGVQHYLECNDSADCFVYFEPHSLSSLFLYMYLLLCHLCMDGLVLGSFWSELEYLVPWLEG